MTQSSSPHQSRARRVSSLTLTVWGLIGVVAGFVTGALGLLVGGGQGPDGLEVDVWVKVFGLTIRQGAGLESMERVIWTWGAGVLAAFSAIGAAIFVAARWFADRLFAKNASPESPQNHSGPSVEK